MHIIPSIRQATISDQPQIIKLLTTSMLNDLIGHEYDDFLVSKILETSSRDKFFALVGSVDNRIVAFALATEVAIDGCLGTSITPIVVAPEYRNQGIGTLLINRIEQICRKYNHGFSCLLGPHNYFGRMGYFSSELFGIVRPKIMMPIEDCLIKELIPGYLDGIEGQTVSFLDPFNDIYVHDYFVI